MTPRCKVSTAKDSPLIKELYAIFDSGQIGVNDKATMLWSSLPNKFDGIELGCFCNVFNKAKKRSSTKLPHHKSKLYAFITSTNIHLNRSTISTGSRQQSATDQNHRNVNNKTPSAKSPPDRFEK